MVGIVEIRDCIKTLRNFYSEDQSRRRLNAKIKKTTDTTCRRSVGASLNLCLYLNEGK